MARYKLNDPRDYLAALDFLNFAKQKNLEIELKKYYPKRTNKQNKYYHFVCSYFAHEYGCTEYEAENVYMKQFAAPHIFEVENVDKGGRKIHYYRSSADLNTVEMSNAINNFVAYASCNGIEIPLPDDEIGIRYCERQIEKTAAYGT